MSRAPPQFLELQNKHRDAAHRAQEEKTARERLERERQEVRRRRLAGEGKLSWISAV
jgi:hypothetical protein